MLVNVQPHIQVDSTKVHTVQSLLAVFLSGTCYSVGLVLCARPQRQLHSGWHTLAGRQHDLTLIWFGDGAGVQDCKGVLGWVGGMAQMGESKHNNSGILNRVVLWRMGQECRRGGFGIEEFQIDAMGTVLESFSRRLFSPWAVPLRFGGKSSSNNIKKCMQGVEGRQGG